MSLLSKHLEPINRELKKKVLGPKQMNERFEQMMLEATKDMPQGYYVPGEYFQKFAELIVQECLDQLHVSDWDEDYDKGIYWSREQIKNHFGVEA